MSLPRTIAAACVAALLALPAAQAAPLAALLAAKPGSESFSDILSDVDDYVRAISVARACGMAAERADRAVSMVMVYAYAAAKPRLADEERRRDFLVQVIEGVSREPDVGSPDKDLCRRSFQALDQLPTRLDEAVRKAG